MEQAIERNKGVLPVPYKTESASENENLPDLPNLPDEEQIQSEPESEDKPTTHIRTPAVHRNAARIVMSLCALCGAAAGALLHFVRGAETAPAGTAFGEVFAARLLTGAAFLSGEYILGFFAIGDILVWILPLWYSMGVGLRAASSGSLKLLPCAIIALTAAAFGAAASADFSRTLMRLSDGGTVYLESSPRRSYALRFLGYFITMTAAALLEGLFAAYT